MNPSREDVITTSLILVKEVRPRVLLLSNAQCLMFPLKEGETLNPSRSFDSNIDFHSIVYF